LDLTSIAAPDLKKRGLQYYRNGDYVKAGEYFNALAVKDPTRAENHAYLANVEYRKGDLRKAEVGFRKAIEINPTEAKFHSNLGTLYVHSKQFERATEIFEVAMKLNPTDGTMKKNRDGARMQLKASIIREDLLSGNTTRLEGVFEGKGYTNAEEIAFRVAVDAYPEILKLGIKLLKGCIDRAPKFAITRHLLGDILLDLRDRRVGAAWVDENKRLTEEVKSMIVESLEIGGRYPELGVGGAKGNNINCATANCEKMALEEDEEEFDKKIMEGNLLVVCVSTAMRAELKTLQKSAEALGLKLDILGMGQKWEGLGSKVTMFTEYLKDKNDDDVVLFVDAFDVLLLPDTKEIKQRFAENFSGAKVVLSGEKASSPDRSSSLVFPDLDYNRPYQFLNSGSYIGLVKHVKLMLEDVSADIAEHHSFTGASPLALDDQRWFTRYYLRNPAVSTMDLMGVMFHTLHDIDSNLLNIVQGEGGEVLGLDSNVTHLSPCLIHGNGNGITSFHQLADRLMVKGWPPGVDSLLGGGTTSPIDLKLRTGHEIEK